MFCAFIPSTQVQIGKTENSIKGGLRDPVCCKLTQVITDYVTDYVSPNQSCEVFGDFGQKN